MPQSRRLNLFQQVMALWEEVHPYNAVVVLHLRERADVARLQAAVQTGCQLAGVGKLVLDPRRRRYHYEPVESIDLRQITSSVSAVESLGRIVTVELNAPFPHGPHHPVRWLVLDDPQTDSHYLLAVYRHLVADAVAIRLLLQRVLNRYWGTSQPHEERPLEVHPPDSGSGMRHHWWRLGYFRTLVRAVRLYFRLRHVHRMPDHGRGDRSQFCLFEATDGFIGSLAAACRLKGVTVTEAFLAALGAALAEITPDRLQHNRRHGLALVTMADVRTEADKDHSSAFGIYLGQSVMVIEPPDLTDFETLLRRITQGMRVEKREKRFTGFQWSLLVLTLLRRWLSLRGTCAWYRKVYPLSAGMSSVRIDASWFGEAGDRLLNYLATATTGPASPLVLVLYTYRERLNLAVSYCESSLTPPEIIRLVEIFFAHLENFFGLTYDETFRLVAASS